MKKVLITGSTGFVGKALCELPALSEFEVIAAHRTLPFKPNPDIEHHVLGDFNGYTDWQLALKNVDVVIHLAARAHVMNETVTDPLAAFRINNVDATLELARQAAVSGVKRFVYLSSVKVNGESTNFLNPFNESQPANPQDPYGVSKYEAELGLREIEKTSGMQVVIIRPPLIYGPGVKANFLKLLLFAHSRVPLPLASVRNKRSFIYLGNLVDAIFLCAWHPQAAGQTYLVSDGEDLSTAELINSMCEAFHRKSYVFRMPVTLMRGLAKVLGKSATIDRLVESLVVDSTKIRNELGWLPPYSLKEGMQTTADWFTLSRSK
jgi:nucleoside-diphosphate-sugar epimerase